MKALVVGGGIGGLAAALSLHHAGLDVEVHEKSPVPASRSAPTA
jgi:phytoene dehydrogenase-like protein